MISLCHTASRLFTVQPTDLYRPLLLHTNLLVQQASLLYLCVCLPVCIWFIFNSPSRQSLHCFLNLFCPSRLNLNLPYTTLELEETWDITHPFRYNHYNYLCFTHEKSKTHEKWYTQSHTTGRGQQGTERGKQLSSVHFVIPNI